MKRELDGPPPPAAPRAPRRRGHALTSRLDGHPPDGLAHQLAARESIRTYSEQPLARAHLDRFLDLTARAYAAVTHPILGTTSLRNYPSGGARYALEVYLGVLNVRGLGRGFYHYHAFHHRLEFLGHKSRYLDALRQAVRLRMDRRDEDPGEPAVLFLIIAVAERVCWKYDGISLPLIFQECGALYQTMYLAAGDLGLAPCAVGAFPERAVGEILGLDPVNEVQVGLFALGVPGQNAASRGPLTIERFAVRRGSPFSADPRHYSVELGFAGGLTEAIDARDFSLARSGSVLTCPVQRGRRRGVFTGRALAAINRLISERDGRARCRVGRGFVPVDS